MQHLNGDIDSFLHSKFFSCVDFAQFNDNELGFAVYNCHVPHSFFSNPLQHCSRIIPNQNAFFKKFIERRPVPWKLYWRSERTTSVPCFSDMLMHSMRRNTDALLLLKLPDSVVVVLRFSLPFEQMKKSRQSILFTEQMTSIEEPLQDFIHVNSVFTSRTFGYANEYTLNDKTYKMAIDVSSKSLQIYRGDKRATFAHLRMDEITSKGEEQRVLLSVDLTRFNRRMLTGRRPHPLVRKAPVLDVEVSKLCLVL